MINICFLNQKMDISFVKSFKKELTQSRKLVLMIQK